MTTTSNNYFKHEVNVITTHRLLFVLLFCKIKYVPHVHEAFTMLLWFITHSVRWSRVIPVTFLTNQYHKRGHSNNLKSILLVHVLSRSMFYLLVISLWLDWRFIEMTVIIKSYSNCCDWALIVKIMLVKKE